MSMKRLSRDEAFLIAANLAKLPSVPWQILKDIPRPTNRPAGAIECGLGVGPTGVKRNTAEVKIVSQGPA